MTIPALAPDLVLPVLTTALAEVVSALTVPVGRALVSPGAEVAWDDCCAGQAWVRLISLTPAQLRAPRNASGGFGSISVVGPCGVLGWDALIGAGVLRCASVLNDAGEAPSPRTLTAEAAQVLLDAAEVAYALQCGLAPQLDRLNMGRWDPLGPGGGCVGGEWQATALVGNCGCEG